MKSGDPLMTSLITNMLATATMWSGHETLGEEKGGEGQSRIK